MRHDSGVTTGEPEAQGAEPPSEPAASTVAPEAAPQAAAIPESDSDQRRLRRSRSDRVIAGVCGGLGRYLGVDPVLIRIAALILVFAGGAGVLLYVIGWIAIPEDEEGADAATPGTTPASSRVVVGGLFVALGAFLLIDELAPDVFDWRFVGPVILIAIGIAVLLGRRS
jgi:phage shock protein C